ncbi:hypothetical protein PO124_03035 [Bacillus licheniformis]|nr:hypothetical protein [Bacillus licheniformis]
MVYAPLLLLEAGTFALLYAVMLVYRRVDKRGLRRLSLALWGRLSVCFSTLFFMESFADLPGAFRWPDDWVCGLDGLRVCHVFDDTAHP